MDKGNRSANFVHLHEERHLIGCVTWLQVLASQVIAQQTWTGCLWEVMLVFGVSRVDAWQCWKFYSTCGASRHSRPLRQNPLYRKFLFKRQPVAFERLALSVLARSPFSRRNTLTYLWAIRAVRQKPPWFARGNDSEKCVELHMATYPAAFSNVSSDGNYSTRKMMHHRRFLVFMLE